jgi:hypothetical protein
MPTFPFTQVDAFTDRPLGGNPCAIVFDADTLDDATMLAIAREMNLSETWTSSFSLCIPIFRPAGRKIGMQKKKSTMLPQAIAALA